MPDKIIKFDPRTKQIVDNLNRTIQQTEDKLWLLCQVYLNAKGKDSEKRNFQLLPDNTGLIEVEKDKNKNKESSNGN